jgi:hypothetical protein
MQNGDRTLRRFNSNVAHYRKELIVAFDFQTVSVNWPAGRQRAIA